MTASRRTFLTSTAATLAAASATSVRAAGSDVLKIGLIGCGGRGSGSVVDAMKADKNVKLVAMCDIFPDFLENALEKFKKQSFVDRIDVPKERQYTGFDGYKQLIDTSGCDIVFMASPPGFRPMQLAYAIEKGKHVFAEKPMAVDAAGVRAVLAAAKKAEEKKLMCASGFCYRYEKAKRETVKRIHDGMIGEVMTIQATFNTGPIWYREIPKEWDEMKTQVRNWYYYTWLSGDFIVEQHCHNLDKAQWVLKGEMPIAATGMGGRQVRTDAKYGNIYDHFAVVFEYADGKRVFSYCRQMPGTKGDVSDHIFATKGTAALMKHQIKHGSSAWIYDGEDTNMYVQEHKEFFEALRAGRPINDMVSAANSTMMAVLGRQAAYTGQRLEWAKAMAANDSLAPVKYDWGPNPVPPVAKPGVVA